MAKKTHGKMLTTSGHKGNANQNHSKILPRPCKNSHHQKQHKQQILVRIWEKRNPHRLMVGMQASTTTLENNMEASSKTKHRSAI
jgi:hypothetical protein